VKEIDLLSRIGLLHQILSSDKTRVGFLIGAGCSTSIKIGDEPLIPNISGLSKIVQDAMNADEELKAHYASLYSRAASDHPDNANIEHILTHLRALKEIVGSGTIEGLTKPILEAIEVNICKVITGVVQKDLTEPDSPHFKLVRWIGSLQRAYPVEIFTPNYDLLLEQALEHHEVPYFDGFSGSRYAFFDLSSIDDSKIPPQWARLWKLHGSINWWKTEKGAIRSTSPPAGAYPQMIYPSHLKYEQSRRLPYLAMMDQLSGFFSKDRDKCVNVLVTCGYSCADDHINDAIIQGLGNNQRNSTCFCLIFDNLDEISKAAELAKMRSNITLIARDKGIVNCEIVRWSDTIVSDSPFTSSSVIQREDKFECDLGNFNSFANFLASNFLFHIEGK